MNRLMDFHIHSNSSDGKLSGYEIIDYAFSNNVSVISITDHDTVSVYTKALFEYANTKSVKLIPGVEISTKYNGVSIHLLGYNIDLENKELIDFLNKINKSRRDYLDNVYVALKNSGYYLDIDTLKKVDSVTKGNIAVDVLNHECNKNKLVSDFGKVPNVSEFIENVLNEGCSAFVKRDDFSTLDAAEIISRANGLVVLAHPALYHSLGKMTVDEVKKLCILIKASGIESYYIYSNDGVNWINEIEIWSGVAKELNVFETVGSDFHDFNNYSPLIGFTDYKNLIKKYDFDNIEKKLILK